MDTIHDSIFMEEALKQAQIALSHDEVPIGAVIVDETNTIIARAFNSVEADKCQNAHAEIKAIEQACKNKNNWRLEGCTMYVTLEPCLMCFGLINLSRMKGICFGASSPLFGCGLDNKDAFPVYKKDLTIRGGLKTVECVAMLQQFFKRRRISSKGVV
jgi:tRNA(adenine34) deaminase